ARLGLSRKKRRPNDWATAVWGVSDDRRTTGHRTVLEVSADSDVGGSEVTERDDARTGIGAVEVGQDVLIEACQYLFVDGRSKFSNEGPAAPVGVVRVLQEHHRRFSGSRCKRQVTRNVLDHRPVARLGEAHKDRAAWATATIRDLKRYARQLLYV